VKENQVKRPRDSHDDLDLATDVRLLCNDVAWAKGALVDDVEAAAGCERSAVCAAHATLVVACAPRRRVGHGRAHARRLFSSMSRGHTSTPHRRSLHLNLNAPNELQSIKSK
jgi:hypothetical protein